ncbi:MAG: IS3 family transposase [archaeon]
MMYQLIQQNHGVLSLDKACALINAPSQPVEKKDSLLEQIFSIAAESPKYGYRRITEELHRRNQKINHKRVLNIMHQNGLQPKKKRKYVKTTDSNHTNPIYPNLTKNKIINGLNEVWPADITYIYFGNNEKAYLATIIDKYSRKCLGWQLSRNIDTQLCVDALTMALNTREKMSIVGLIHHSDRGSTYTSEEYTRLLKEHGITISMSRKATPTDNARAESFFKTVKYEEVFMNEYNSFTDAYENIKHFIEEVYNQKRLHSAIGYQPPTEFEEKILKNEGS